MKIDKKIAMISHLSDVQTVVDLLKDKIGEKNEDEPRQKINFVKVLIDDDRTELTQEELDQLWSEVHEKFAK